MTRTYPRARKRQLQPRWILTKCLLKQRRTCRAATSVKSSTRCCAASSQNCAPCLFLLRRRICALASVIRSRLKRRLKQRTKPSPKSRHQLRDKRRRARHLNTRCRDVRCSQDYSCRVGRLIRCPARWQRLFCCLWRATSIRISRLIKARKTPQVRCSRPLRPSCRQPQSASHRRQKAKRLPPQITAPKALLTTLFLKVLLLKKSRLCRQVPLPAHHRVLDLRRHCPQTTHRRQQKARSIH